MGAERRIWRVGVYLQWKRGQRSRRYVEKEDVVDGKGWIDKEDRSGWIYWYRRTVSGEGDGRTMRIEDEDGPDHVAATGTATIELMVL